uniref:Transposase n=1 Tax=Acrobeloides nanus TaxID=290746 RepID=A0A914DL86_9BILA
MANLSGRIIRLFEQGKSGYEIAKLMKSYDTVKYIIRRYQETGNNDRRPEVDVEELLERQLIDRKSKEESTDIQAAKRILTGNWEKRREYHMFVQLMLKKDLGMKSRREKAQLLKNIENFSE